MLRHKFYVTTPIYYVNDAPHIGHSYTTILADVLIRFHRLFGDETFFLTGTDEHGQKVQQAAQKNGLTPKDHCDKYSLRFKEAWTKLDITYDKFIRTTDLEHIQFVQDFLQRLWDRGHIYTKSYGGWYSTGEERFFAQDELINGKDPISGRDVEWVEESNYFFKMSAYQKWLIEYIQNHPDFILPDFRKNEVIGFLQKPLEDLCISRPKSRLAWGIELPFDKDYVSYVWVDALCNYYSAILNRKWSDGSSLWPVNLHLLAKDILTTHCVYWTTLLEAAGFAQPQCFLAHGYWMSEGTKMSKTTGNVVDPFAMADQYGSDSLRYYLMREMVVGQDGNFTQVGFITRVNSDLANDLGNGLSRIHRLAISCLQGKLSLPADLNSESLELKDLATTTCVNVRNKIEKLKISFAVEEVMLLIRALNRYLESKAPWKLAKQVPLPEKELNEILAVGTEVMRVSLALLSPIIPIKAPEALAILGFPPVSPLQWGAQEFGRVQEICPPLFPRIEVKAAPSLTPVTKNTGSTEQEFIPYTSLDFRVAQIESVEAHPDAENLWVLSINVGDEKRTVCAGLRKHCSIEDLLHRKVILLANLKAAKIRGIESQGMLLAATNAESKLVPVSPADGEKIGEKLTFAGIHSAPKSTITMKEFEKSPLSAKGGKILAIKAENSSSAILQGSKGSVNCEGVDGTEVR